MRPSTSEASRYNQTTYKIITVKRTVYLQLKLKCPKLLNSSKYPYNTELTPERFVTILSAL